MNKEEKEAIKELKEEINKPVELPEDKFDTFILFNIKSAKTVLNYIDKLQKKNEQSQEILSSIKIAYMVHTKDCELLLKDIKKWEKLLDK